MRARHLAIVLLAAGCGAITHPRYAPDIAPQWDECQRIAVIPGSIKLEVKNYKVDDYFLVDSVGRRQGQFFAQAIGRVLRNEGQRDPRFAGDAERSLGGDTARAREAADRMLEVARAAMAHDAGYTQDRLWGLTPRSQSAVPEELRRDFDAIVVVGGRIKFESEHEEEARMGDIILRNLVADPILIVSVFFPPLFPAYLVSMAQGLSGYWVGPPNMAYFTIAIYAGKTGRLLYVDDWFATEKVDELEDFEKVARDLLRPMIHIRQGEPKALGEAPEGWRAP
ncbi:MAG TPA: hypothetical protein VFF73_09265 [Planctomycetota bacterium]|nr:hypothetical protein [Planctomycetota bacterium]